MSIKLSYIKKLGRQQKYNSLEELFTAFVNLEKDVMTFKRQAMGQVGVYLRNTIKSKYGVRQAGWPKGTNATPLYDTGELRKGVSYTSNKDIVEVFMKGQHTGSGLSKDVLAGIHEYGSVAGNRRIPARPIWQRVQEKEIPAITEEIQRILFELF